MNLRVSRRFARKWAMQFIYHCDILEQYKYTKKEVKNYLNSIQEVIEKSSKEMLDFCIEIINYFLSNKEEVDQYINKYLINWDFKRLAVIDKSLFRIAVAERKHFNTDISIICNEIIELGKKYSTKDASEFLNGVLDKILNDEDV